MANDEFWAGVFAGAVGCGLVAYYAWKFHTASYESGWNGEELVSKGLFGFLGRTNKGNLVLTSSFNQGKYDREVKLSVDMLRYEIKSIAGQVRHVTNELNRLEQETPRKADILISKEEQQFVKDLHDIAKERILKPRRGPPQRVGYTV